MCTCVQSTFHLKNHFLQNVHFNEVHTILLVLYTAISILRKSFTTNFIFDAFSHDMYIHVHKS